MLSTSEEQTERCFIIENIDTIFTEETDQIDQDHKTYSSQTSQDSGNYSNEDENSGSRVGDDLGQPEPGSDPGGVVGFARPTREPEPLASARTSRGDLLVGEEGTSSRS